MRDDMAVDVVMARPGKDARVVVECLGCGRRFTTRMDVLGVFWDLRIDGTPERCRSCGSARPLLVVDGEVLIRGERRLPGRCV